MLLPYERPFFFRTISLIRACVSNIQARVTRGSHSQATHAHEGIQFLIQGISDVRQRHIATIACHVSFEFFLYCYKKTQYSEEEEEKRDADEHTTSLQVQEDSTQDKAGLADPCQLLHHSVGIDMNTVQSYESYAILRREGDDSDNHIQRLDDAVGCHECSLQNILETIDIVMHLRSHPHVPIPENLSADNPLPSPPTSQTLCSHGRDFEGPKRVPQKRKGKQKKHDTIRPHLGCPTISLAYRRLWCQLAMAFRHGTPSTIMLAGPTGCGKRHIISDVASALGHIEVMDILSFIQSKQFDDGSPTFEKEVCEALNSAFTTAMEAPAPTIMVLHHVERVFITSSIRDNESNMSLLARAIKPCILKQKDKLHAGRVVLIGTTSKPDDCAGKDLEDLLEFFDNYITLPQLDYFTRMMHIQHSLETHQPFAAADETPSLYHWTIQSALAWTNPNASWNDIDTATKQISDNPLPLADAVSQYHTLLQHAQNNNARQAQTIQIESWMQRILPQRIQLLHK